MGNDVERRDTDVGQRARASLIEAAKLAAELAVARLNTSALPNVAEVTALMNASANALTASCAPTQERE